VLVKEKDTSDHNRGEWSVRCYTVSLDIWRVERCVCFWLSWFRRPITSCTVVTFFAVRTCFSLPLPCLWSVLPVSRIFSVKCPVLSFCSLSSKIQSLFSENCIFWTGINS